MGVDSNDGVCVALRQISLPIATKVGYNLPYGLSYIQPVYGIFFSRLFSPLFAFLAHLSFSLILCFSLANAKVDKREKRQRSNTVFTAIIIFASYPGPASPYLSFCHWSHPPFFIPLLLTVRVFFSLYFCSDDFLSCRLSPACFFKCISVTILCSYIGST